MAPAARTMSAPSSAAEKYSALEKPYGNSASGGEAATLSIHNAMKAAPRLTNYSRASDSSPTEPLSHHAHVLSPMVAVAAATASQAKRSRLLEFIGASRKVYPPARACSSRAPRRAQSWPHRA